MPSLHAVSLSSNIARNTSGSGVVPPALLDEKKIPKFYQDAISLCGAFTASQLPNTNKVYNLMITSNLSRLCWAISERGIVGSALWSVFFANPVLTKLYSQFSGTCQIKDEKQRKDIKPVVDSMPPQFSTRVSSVQSSKIVAANTLLVDLNSSSVSQEGSTAKAVNKLPCVEDLFAPDPFNEPTEDGLPASTSKNGLSLVILSTLISVRLVSETVETLPSSEDTNVLDESQKLLERITVWDECLAQVHSIYSQAQHLISNAQALEIAQVQEVLQKHNEVISTSNHFKPLM